MRKRTHNAKRVGTEVPVVSGALNIFRTPRTFTPLWALLVGRPKVAVAIRGLNGCDFLWIRAIRAVVENG